MNPDNQLEQTDDNDESYNPESSDDESDALPESAGVDSDNSVIVETVNDKDKSTGVPSTGVPSTGVDDDKMSENKDKVQDNGAFNESDYDTFADELMNNDEAFHDQVVADLDQQMDEAYGPRSGQHGLRTRRA